MLLYIATLMGDSLVVDRVYKSYLTIFLVHNTHIDLIVLDIMDFNVIMGMDYLKPYHTILEYIAKMFTLAMLCIPMVVWLHSFSCMLMRIISFIHARR